MFEKNLTKPLVLEQHEAVLRRIEPTNPIRPEVEANKEKYRIGYLGEKKINYFLGLLPSQNFHIFHNIRLPAEKGFFQMDTYLLSSIFSIIIEGKNLSGTLHLERNQLTQEINGEKKVYENPLTQVYRHKILLKHFFDKYQLPIIPSEHLVCFSNTSSMINIIPGYTEAEKRVCKAVDIIRKIYEFENFYKKETIDQRSIENLKQLILEKDTPRRMDILSEYHINKKGIAPGVQCLKCNCLAMNYRYGFWECPNCYFCSRDAYLQALNDYFLIFGTTITNSK